MSTKYKLRIFARGDDSVRNGSFKRVFYYPLSYRGVSVYMNGDYMGMIKTPELKTKADCDAECERLLTAEDEDERLVEYTKDRWTELAPACFK